MDDKAGLGGLEDRGARRVRLPSRRGLLSSTS